MMRNGKKLVLALSALTIGHGVLALTSDSGANPYHGIVDRNIFDIHAAAPPPPVDLRPSMPPPPTIKLQGITDILGRKQVLFKTQLPAKPPTPPKEESFILTVGERQGEIEVLEIDPKAGTVKMSNYGVITNLSLELNSDKLVNVAPVAPAPTPAQMTAPGTIAPPPGIPPSLPPGRFPRTLRLPGSNNAQPSAEPGMSGGYGGGNQNPQQIENDHLNQIANMALQKQIARQSKNPLIKAMDPIIPMPRELQKEFDNADNPPPPPPLPQ